MSNFLGIVVGIDNVNNTEVYRVVVANVNKKAENQYDWKFECKMLSTEQVIQTFKQKASWLNIKIEGGKIKGSSGALSRFTDKVGTSNHHPVVIISQLANNLGKVIGYKIARYDGTVKNVPLKEIISYGNRVSKAGLVPVQNAMFVSDEPDKKAHFKAYPNKPFITEVIVHDKNEYTKVNRLNTSKNEKTLSKLDEIYSKEQLMELKKGKASGVDIRIYANPALSAKQMCTLREGLEAGVNVRPLAFPEFTFDAMRFYIENLKDGMDIRNYLNAKYDTAQLFQLSLACELGLDISKMANPSLSADDMAEIAVRLENHIFKDEMVKKDGSWK